jgi:uncharacterized protein YndB with AHSA1/START domain
MIWLWIACGALGAVVLAGLVMWAIGRRLPEEHTARVTLRLERAAPEAVFAVITDMAAYPSWSAVNRVDRLPDRDGREAWRQRIGRNSFVLERTRHQPPRLVEYTIADDAKFFSGSWLYEISPGGGEGGCEVTITEHGRVHPAIPRFIMHYLVDPSWTARKHLSLLARRLGEPGASVEKQA